MKNLHLIDLKAAIHWVSTGATQQIQGLNDLQDLAIRMGDEGNDSIEDILLTGNARDLWLRWYASTPDTPCIAICSTSQGDDQCKGCGRTFQEVIDWLGYSAFEKRSIWLRITREAVAWRFNHYKERAR